MARMNPRLPVREQLDEVMAELRETLSQLEHGGSVTEYDDRGHAKTRRTPPLSQVFILVSASVRDGFRTSSRPNQSPGSVLDDQGVPMPPLSDPTGELATEAVKVHDPIRKHAESALWALVNAQGMLRKAKSEMIRAFEEDDVSDGDPRCAPHALAGYFVEPERGERCGWCYRFWLAEGVDPPPVLVRAKEMAGRVTSRMVREALAPKPRGKKGRKGAA